ncbi:MAG: PLP-dependent transferase [Treponema sp.]|nr:PLP-dependent transferase [Spirochaetia bacterium]MDY5811929.1 PLP-dependent transferase [Treponema sp.]
MGFNTDALHKGLVKDKSFGATITPIYQVSAFSYDSMESLEKVFNGRAAGFAYTRIGNPTVASFNGRRRQAKGSVCKRNNTGNES